MGVLVGARVGVVRRAQQGQPDGRGGSAALACRAGDVVAVRGVVQHRDAVAGLADVDPAVVVALEARHVPTGVRVGGPADVPELDLRNLLAGVHVDRERRLEHLLRLVPVDLGLDIQSPVAGTQHEALADAGLAERALHQDRPQQRAVLDDLDRVGVDQVDVAAQVVSVDVPGIPLVRVVGMQLQEVAGAGEDLAVGDQVADRRDQAGRVDAHPQQGVVQLPRRHGHRRDVGG